MSDSSSSESSIDIEALCTARFAEQRQPIIVVRPSNGRIMYANASFLGSIRISRSDEPVERISDIVRRGDHQSLREEMIELLKDPSSPRRCTIELKEALFAATTAVIELSMIDVEGGEYVAACFEQPAAVIAEPLETAGGGSDEAVAARVAELEREVAEMQGMYQRFAHVIGHELKAPLTAIKGYAELLEFDVAQRDDPETLQILKLIIRTSERLYGYIESMYHLSTQDLQTRKYRTTDLQKLFDELRAEMERQTQTQAITLTFDREKLRIKCNPTLLREVLYQLMTAECLASKLQGTFIHLRYRAIEGRHCFILAHCLDAEIGFPDDFDARLRSLLAQEDGRRATLLGFEFARKFVGMEGGAIALERGEQGRNTYYLSFPAP